MHTYHFTAKNVAFCGHFSLIFIQAIISLSVDCQSIEAPANGSINYSSQLIIDKIDCNPGFEPEYDENPDIYVEFPAAFDCVCLKSGECKWYYGPNDDKEVTFENLPRCVNTREKNCQSKCC